MSNSIRLLSITAQNIKNMKSGKITFDSFKKVMGGDFDFDCSDVVGIYGPNGSSKTTIINALMILKKIFSLDNFSDELINYIAIDSNTMKISAEIFYKQNEYKAVYEYSVLFKRVDKEAFIAEEILNYKVFNNETDKFMSKKTIFDINFEDNNIKTFIKPATTYDRLINKSNERLGTLLMLKGRKYEAKNSLIFSIDFIKQLLDAEFDEEQISFLSSLIKFGRHFMYVYDNREISQIAAMDSMPFLFIEESIVDDSVETIKGHLSLFKEGVVEQKFVSKIMSYVDEINGVITTIIPGLKIKFINLGETINDKNKKCVKYAFSSLRDNKEIPLRFESDGIKKLISILSSFISAFNNESSFLAIDEFDSGIFEYLLGELLIIFKEDAKGQLLFTSHNLRALEVVKDDILFTTNDEYDRFKKMKYVNSTNNLRDVYIKENFFNNDEFSSRIDANKIANALYCAEIDKFDE